MITDHLINSVKHIEQMDVVPEMKIAMYAIDLWCHRAHETSVAKGWYEQERNQGEIIALVHSELSEALEALRKGNPPDEHCPEYSSVEIEYADAVIRIMDTCAANGYRLGAAIAAKMAYNESRPMKHGGKLF